VLRGRSARESWHVLVVQYTKSNRLVVVGIAVVALLLIWRLVASTATTPRPEPVVGDVPADETHKYTIDVAAGTLLDFGEIAGDVTIDTLPEGPLQALVTKHSYGTDKASALLEVHSFDVVPHRIDRAISFALGSAARPRRQVDYKIGTPPDVSVKIDGGNGHVNIQGLHGAVDITGDDVSLKLENNRGPITIRNRTGSLSVANSIGRTLVQSQTSVVQLDHLTAEALEVATAAKTVIKDSGSESGAKLHIDNGDLALTRFRAKTLTAAVPDGQINVTDTTATDMDLQGQAKKINLVRVFADNLHATTTTGLLNLDQTQGNLDIKTQGGSVTMSGVGAMGLRIAAGTGDVTFNGRLPQAGEHSIQTSSGNISVRVVKESAFRVEASTAGSLTVGQPFVLEQAAQTSGHWHGVINQGAMLLALTSTSGNILIGSDQLF
jgi:Putative adhesin